MTITLWRLLMTDQWIGKQPGQVAPQPQPVRTAASGATNPGKMSARFSPLLIDYA